MTIEQAYFQIKQKTNTDTGTDQIDLDKGRFVYLFNEYQNKFVEWILDKKNEDDYRKIQGLLVSDSNLTLVESEDIFSTYKLPTDHLDLSSIRVFAKYGTCTSTELTSVFEMKNDNVSELMADEFNKPSFSARETFYHLGSNNVKVYKLDFDIQKVLYTYYRYPRQVDMEGYIKPDTGVATTQNIDPELEDRLVLRILDAIAKEYDTNNNHLQKVAIDKDRVFSNI